MEGERRPGSGPRRGGGAALIRAILQEAGRPLSADEIALELIRRGRPFRPDIESPEERRRELSAVLHLIAPTDGGVSAGPGDEPRYQLRGSGAPSRPATWVLPSTPPQPVAPEAPRPGFLSPQPPPERAAGGPGAPSRAARLRAAAFSRATVICASLVLLTAALRGFHLTTAFDVYIDEITYMRISQGVAAHISLQLYGKPFYLHPPGFFLAEGAFLRIVNPGGDVAHLVYACRYVSVAFAAATVVPLFNLARRFGGLGSAVTASVIYALDPFNIRTSSRNLLEAATMFWVVLGFCILAGGRNGERLSLRRCCAGGLALGLGLLFKETSAPIAVLPLALCFMFRWAIPRRQTILIAAVAAVTYMVYPLALLATGGIGEYGKQKFHGVARLLGFIQETGFHRPGAPSFLSTVLQNLPVFGATYAIIGSGLLATAYLLVRGGGANQLAASWALGAFGLLGYAVAFGALEEQMFFFLVVPASVAIAAAVPQFLAAAQGRRRRIARAVARGMVVGFLGVSLAVWGQFHFIADDGVEQLARYVAANVPVNVAISVTSEAFDFTMPPNQDLGTYVSVGAMRVNRVGFVEVSSREVAEGYASGGARFFAWVYSHAQPVFCHAGRFYGDLCLYRLDDGALTPLAGAGG